MLTVTCAVPVSTTIDPPAPGVNDTIVPSTDPKLASEFSTSSWQSALSLSSESGLIVGVPVLQST